MAIYHLTASVISRARGHRVVATAAARSGTRLRDDHYGITHNFAGQPGFTHSEILAPPTAPSWTQHRETLWNRVEARERRKDAQLARALEIALPLELTQEQCVGLLRDFVSQEFVLVGMIADVSIRRTDGSNPQAFILLTLRRTTADGFGPKARDWNRKSALVDWRHAWAERANQHLARAGHDVRIDHRTLGDQQIELTPSRRIGLGTAAAAGRLLPGHLEHRIAEQRSVVAENGDSLMADPDAALRAITRQRATFTADDMLRFVRSRTVDSAQRAAVLQRVMDSAELVPVAADATAEPRYTTRDLVEAGKSLMKRAAAMAARRGHGVPPIVPVDPLPAIPEYPTPALAYVLEDGDCKALVVPESQKMALLRAARHAWQVQGFAVRGAALSRRAAQRLAVQVNIPSTPVADYEASPPGAQSPLSANDVLIVDGAEMIGLKQLEKLVGMADRARAKVVLVGDPPQLQAMGSMSPLHALIDRHDERPTAA